MKHGQKGGLHPVDCTCGRNGCWSNTTWLKARVAKAIAEKKPLPSSWPEKYRNLVIQDVTGEDVATSKDGEVPTVSEQVKERLGRKPLPMPSEVRQQTIVTEQVALAADLPWGMIAATINSQLPEDAPATARLDSSKEKERILNEDFHAAFPDIMVGPKLKFAIDVVLWALPAVLFWVPRWIKAKWKNFKWPWDKKKPAVTPEVPPPLPTDVHPEVKV